MSNLDDTLLIAMRKIAMVSYATQPPPQTHEYEQMSGAKWKRAIPDTLASVAGMGIGYGVSRTALDIIGERMAAQGKQLPGFAKYVPLIGTVGSGLAGFGMSRTRGLMKERRAQAQAEADAKAALRAEPKTAGVEPAPQARSIPRKKPTDPWNYDPNPAYEL